MVDALGGGLFLELHRLALLILLHAANSCKCSAACPGQRKLRLMRVACHRRLTKNLRNLVDEVLSGRRSGMVHSTLHIALALQVNKLRHARKSSEVALIPACIARCVRSARLCALHRRQQGPSGRLRKQSQVSAGGRHNRPTMPHLQAHNPCFSCCE